MDDSLRTGLGDKVLLGIIPFPADQDVNRTVSTAIETGVYFCQSRLIEAV